MTLSAEPSSCQASPAAPIALVVIVPPGVAAEMSSECWSKVRSQVSVQSPVSVTTPDVAFSSAITAPVSVSVIV